MIHMIHKSVLLQEVISGLDPKSSDIFVDGTINGGVHSEEIAKIAPGITIVGLDMDEDALARCAIRMEGTKAGVHLVNINFRAIDRALDGLHIHNANKILLDLGLSSNQLEESGRGFSFQKSEPLLMSFKKNPSETDLTAKDILNNWDEENIAQVIWSYGEERRSRAMAKEIVSAREKKSIETTNDVVRILDEAGFKRQGGKIHPATKVFQALRITVNDEIGALKEGLDKGFERLAPEGRMAVISFHSLEDRIIKNKFKELEKSGKAKIITKKPIVPSEAELKENPRSRSAKLRIIQKI